MTTKPLRDFFNEHLQKSQAVASSPRLESFSMVVANPAETGLKFGIKVIHTKDPGRLGKIDVTYDQLSGSCSFRLSNILMWIMPQAFAECRVLSIDGHEMSTDICSGGDTVWIYDRDHWRTDASGGSTSLAAPMRDQNQLGYLDAILRTNDAFTIVGNTPKTAHVALQVSRNLCQYFGADTEITDDYTAALESTGNVISIAFGPSMPGSRLHEHPIEIRVDEVIIHTGSSTVETYEEVNKQGLGAIFIRPLPGGRLELVIWGKDARSLEVAARLAPMMPGSGQPDFVVVDERMLWEGIAGARAMGFFDAWWNVTKSSYLS